MVFLGTVIVFLPQFTTGVYNPTLSQTDDGLCGNRTGVNPYCDQENGWVRFSLTLRRKACEQKRSQSKI